MADILAPSPKQQFLDNNGRPLVGGKLFTYEAATTTKLATYTDAGGLTPNSNPVILDFRGEANVWIPPNVAYKFTLAPANDTDPPTNPIWTVDQIINSQLLSLYGGVDTGVPNAYVISINSPVSPYSDGFVIFWIPSNANTSSSTINVNSLGPIPILNADGSQLSAGELGANVPAIIIYQSGAFILMNPASLSTTGSFPMTVVGATTAPSVTVTYARTGRVITLNVPSTGTVVSDNTGFALSGLPLGLQLGVGAASFSVGGIFATDNSVDSFAGGSAFLSAASANIGFNFEGGTWTAGGNKRMGAFTITYFVNSNFS